MSFNLSVGSVGGAVALRGLEAAVIEGFLKSIDLQEQPPYERLAEEVGTALAVKYCSERPNAVTDSIQDFKDIDSFEEATGIYSLDHFLEELFGLETKKYNSEKEALKEAFYNKIMVIQAAWKEKKNKALDVFLNEKIDPIASKVMSEILDRWKSERAEEKDNADYIKGGCFVLKYYMMNYGEFTFTSKYTAYDLYNRLLDEYQIDAYYQLEQGEDSSTDRSLSFESGFYSMTHNLFIKEEELVETIHETRGIPKELKSKNNFFIDLRDLFNGDVSVETNELERAVLHTLELPSKKFHKSPQKSFGEALAKIYARKNPDLIKEVEADHFTSACAENEVCIFIEVQKDALFMGDASGIEKFFNEELARIRIVRHGNIKTDSRSIEDLLAGLEDPPCSSKKSKKKQKKASKKKTSTPPSVKAVEMHHQEKEKLKALEKQLEIQQATLEKAEIKKNEAEKAAQQKIQKKLAKDKKAEKIRNEKAENFISSFLGDIVLLQIKSSLQASIMIRQLKSRLADAEKKYKGAEKYLIQAKKTGDILKTEKCQKIKDLFQRVFTTCNEAFEQIQQQKATEPFVYQNPTDYQARVKELENEGMTRDEALGQVALEVGQERRKQNEIIRSLLEAERNKKEK